jgi:cytochrome b6-f complex iron-sulfur subunit
MWQRCPHLGCRPNFCATNFWFECPCHGSRVDRLGIKVALLGPAPRSLDRFAHTVQNGNLIVDTSRITLGPLPVTLGQPGLIPRKSPTGCI